eukprot:g3957.t1
MAYHDLVLDRKVLIWVFIPLTCAVTLMMLLRQYAHKLMSLSNEGRKHELKEIRETQSLSKSVKLREQGGWLTPQAYLQRKSWMTAKDTGVLCQKVESRSIQETMATDPSVMVNAVKSHLTGLIPQIMMGAWVNFFFAGFVLGKVPFSLTPRFRPMFQRGIDMQALDVSYFTSLSYYVLLLFGMRGVFSLFFREETIDDTELMRKQMNPMGAMGPQADVQKAFTTEKELLELHEHRWRLEEIKKQACSILETLLKS